MEYLEKHSSGVFYNEKKAELQISEEGGIDSDSLYDSDLLIWDEPVTETLAQTSQQINRFN